MSTRRKQFGVKEVSENADPNIKQRIQRVYAKPHECQYCTKKFLLKYTLSRHELLHMFEGHEPRNADLKPKHNKKHKTSTLTVTKDDKMSHEKCEKTLVNEYSQNHSIEKPFECDLCHKKFDKKSRLDRHKYVHWKGEERWNCDLCPMDFSTENSLTSHKRIHTWVLSLKPHLPFECDHSILIFQSDESGLIGAESINGNDINEVDQQLNDDQIIVLDTDEEISFHQNVNSNDIVEQNNEKCVKRQRSLKKMKPPKIPKISPTKQKIKKSLRSDDRTNGNNSNTRATKPQPQQKSSAHKTQSRIQCDECATYVSSLKLLRRHKLKHSDERPFKCDFCDMAFYRNDKKISHERVHKKS